MHPTISIENLRFATVSCHRPTESYERVHPAKAKCASRYNGVPFHISKSTFYYSGVRRKPGATRGIQKSPFYHSFGHLTSTKWREGCENELQNSHFTSVLDRRPMSTKRREGCQTTQADSHFTSVLDVRWARNDERVARRPKPIRISPQFWTSDEHETTRGLRRRRTKFAFHLSFGRPMSTKRREGSTTTFKIRISPQFWTSDEHETTRGFNDDVQNSHFTTVLDVRWARSDERVVSRLDRPNPPCVKKERNFKEVLIHNNSQQIFWADFLQQIFSADFLSADFLSRSSQQIFSADLLSRSSQQIFSLSYHLLWSGVGGQLLSYHSYHLLWSGVGGQLLSYHLLWSGVGGQLLSYHVGGLYCMSSLEGPFRGAFGKKKNLLNPTS